MEIYNINNISELGTAAAATVGMFDGVHIGHRHILSLLTRVAKEQDCVPVVVTFDRHPRQVLGSVTAGDRFRITTNEERYALLEGCGVEAVLELRFTPDLAQLSACQFLQQVLLERLRIRTLVLGFDNMFGNKQHNDFDQVRPLAERQGVEVLEDTAVQIDGEDVSSTQIRKALLRGDVRRAGQMLGSAYAVSGIVAHGRAVGRQLGFPTANLLIEEEKVLPAPGVYAVRVSAEGREWAGMANLGPQPTFGLEAVTCEVHLIGCDENLYDRRLEVRFVQRLRDIRRFENGEALMRQLERDREQASAIVGGGV